MISLEDVMIHEEVREAPYESVKSAGNRPKKVGKKVGTASTEACHHDPRNTLY